VLGAGIAAAVAVREREGADVHGSSSVGFVTTDAPPPRPPSFGIDWAMNGYDPARDRVAPADRVRPPFRQAWVAGGDSLLEFPPAIAYGRLFYGDGGGRVIALSARTGQRAWVFDSHRGLAASPAVGPYRHGTVYEVFLNPRSSHVQNPQDGLVVALSAGWGVVRWRTRVGASETSPLLAYGRLYVGGWNGTIYALDQATGRIEWRFETGGPVKGGLAAEGGRVYAGSYDGHVYALDARTGRLLWHASGDPRLLGGHGTFYSTPAVADGRVHIGSTDHKLYSFGAATGRERWSHSTGGYVYGSPAVWNGLVLVGSYDHRFYALDAATGAERWRFAADGPVSGSAVVLDGVVYFSTLKETTYGLDASTGAELWRYPDGKYAAVVADAQRLYLMGYSVVRAFVPVAR